MKQYFIRLSIVALVSDSVSVIFTIVAMKAFIGIIHPVGLYISVIAPLVVAVPVTWVFEGQRRKLKAALDALEESHKQLEQLNRELLMQATYDYGTGLLTRRHFVRTVSDQWQDVRQGALLCIDVDNFKVINDTYGHAAGDMALRMLASSISGAVGNMGLVARIGGEEFAVFLTDTSYPKAEKLAEEIRKVVEETLFYPVEGMAHKLSVSIGSAFVIEAKNFEALLAVADRRMYRAKGRGKNCVIFPAEGDLTSAA